MKNTSLAEIVLSAQAAANEAYGAADSLQRQRIKLEKFELAEHAPADFPTWETSFNNQLDMLAAFSKQDSPATRAAKLTAPASTLAKAAALILLALGLVLGPSAHAQIFYGGINQTGLVAAPIQTGFASTSNSVSIPVVQHYLMLTNITTNFNYTFAYGSLLVGQTGTNFVQQFTLTTNLSAANGFTNGGTWLYTVPAQYLTPYATPWASALLPTSNSLGAPFIVFQ